MKGNQIEEEDNNKLFNMFLRIPEALCPSFPDSSFRKLAVLGI